MAERVSLVFQLQQVQYRPRLQAFHDAIDAVVREAEFLRLMRRLVGIMVYADIKQVSYNGACRINRGWVDPGNWSYSIIWQAIRHVAYDRNHREHAISAKEILDLIDALEARWPSVARQFPSRRGVERIGDFMEFILAYGYYAKSGEPADHLLSLIHI